MPVLTEHKNKKCHEVTEEEAIANEGNNPWDFFYKVNSIVPDLSLPQHVIKPQEGPQKRFFSSFAENTKEPSANKQVEHHYFDLGKG